MRIRTRRSDDRGSVAVEFALILPIFLLLVYGGVTFGLAMSMKQTVSQAAAEGARASVSAQVVAGDADLNAAYVRVARARATAALGSAATYATITPLVESPCPSAAANQSLSVCVKVTISYPYSAHPTVPNLPGIGLIVPTNVGATYEVQVS